MHNRTSVSQRQKKLFADKNLWISVLIVSIPALILGFMAGLFAFCDQLMMVKLIPNFLQTNQVFSNYEGYHSIYTSPNLPEDVKKIMMDANGAIPSIIRTAVAYSAPITVFINAAALLLGNGTAINYSKYNGAKNLLMAEKTWTQGFYANLLLSIVVTALCCGICSALISLEQGAGLNDQLNTLAKTNYFIDHPDQFKTVATFYHEYYDEVRRFASQYIYIMGAGCIFALYSQFISLLVIAEGKQVIVVAASIICNGINILLDWVFIKYAHLTMMGGAIATDIGWLLNTLICFSYIIYLERRSDTNLHMQALRKINFKIRDYSELFALGLPSFVRNVSMAIATTVQVALLVAVVNAAHPSTANISVYQSVYGAVNAIANLFWTALFGIINGARIICSYNYGARNFKRVRGSYWVLIVFALIHTIISFGVVCFGINTFMLNLFDIDNSNITQLNLANYILRISIVQMAITAVGIGGMMVFQATGRWWRAAIAGIMQGIIYCVPLSFIIQYAAIQIHNVDLFLWCPFIVVCCSSLTVFIWSIFYMRRHFLDKHAKLAPSLHNVKSVAQEEKILKHSVD